MHRNCSLQSGHKSRGPQSAPLSKRGAAQVGGTSGAGLLVQPLPLPVLYELSRHPGKALAGVCVFTSGVAGGRRSPRGFGTDSNLGVEACESREGGERFGATGAEGGYRVLVACPGRAAGAGADRRPCVGGGEGGSGVSLGTCGRS